MATQSIREQPAGRRTLATNGLTAIGPTPLTYQARTPNRLLTAALWTLTVIALVPFASMALILVGAASNLAANGIALYLLCSRSRVDRVHGAVRLALQLAILIFGAVALWRSGISPAGFFHFVTHGSL